MNALMARNFEFKTPVQLLTAIILCILAVPCAHAQTTPNFRDADIRKIVEAVGEVTGKTFILDPRVTAKVTILSKTPMSPEAFYEAFLSILQVHGYIAITTGDVVKIIPDATARQHPNPPTTEGAAADDIVKNAAYECFSFMAQPAQSNVDVTIGITGFNPYRTSQFLNRQAWVDAGMSPEAASNYLGAIEASLQSPNMVLDLRVPQNQRYQQVVLDTANSQYLAGELTVEEAMQQIFDGWQEITDELGRDEQLAAYLGSLGVQR